MNHVIVPLNAFDRLEVLEKGQASFIPLIAEAGAYGVEIRRELLPEQDLSFDHIRKEIELYPLFTVYSAPVELWKEDHSFNSEELERTFEEGRVLGAKWIKVSLGHFHQENSDLKTLKVFLSQQHDLQLMVENDQTPYGGNIVNLKAFFESASELGVPVRMTFDAGNWFYTDQDVEDALSKLAPYVGYLHLKQVEVRNGELVTLPLVKGMGHSWEKVMDSLPAWIVTALEFPIEPKERTREFIEMITESEGATCSS